MITYDASARERYAFEAPKASAVDRSEFERDRARVLHSAALRRLAGKTQVVGPGVADFPRTRLTHSLECAQIGRELAADLGADPDVVDAACLAHDLGHPPFGHNGEIALDVAAASCGGFEGNAQSLRVLTRLEAKIIDADGVSHGLNLTRAVLDAATKYPWTRAGAPPSGKFGVYADDFAVFEWLRAGNRGVERCLEAQIMDWSDDVAYSVHDVEDGVHAGLIPLDALADTGARDSLAALAAEIYSAEPVDVLRAALDELLAQPWWVASFDRGLRDQVALKATMSELTARFCLAAVRATRAAYGPSALTRYAADLVVPDSIRAECALLKAATHLFVMRRPGAVELQDAERVLVTELVEAVAAAAPARLTPELRAAYADADDQSARLRVVVDQVASLTDASAVAWHARLTA
ncbi:MAG: deoxyguanosinetriphosphate triphosphohydrolase [Actinomycetota bacterium]